MANEEFVEKLIKERYCANEDERQNDTWNNICRRVSYYLGKSDKEVDIFYDMMYRKDFLPNSPTLMNAGTETPMLSACFFLPISDCISNGKDGIFDQVKNAALIFKHGGGVGLNFSNLRPHGSKVKSTNGVSSGVISFMRNFNVMTETIKQGGKRRGALMGCLDVTHPEIKNFITCKTTEGDLSNFNISVKLTDEFMKSVESDSKEELEIFNMIIDGIYKNGEPGLLFSDEIERNNPTPELGTLNVNPCAEALLLNFESCLTGDTSIITFNGNFTIKELKQKTQFDILSYNDKIVFSKCMLVVDNGIKDVYELKLTSGITIKSTNDHKYMTQHGWKMLKNIDIDIDHIINTPISNDKLPNISHIKYMGKEKVYDLVVPDTHCFFANGILVHNCNLGSINWSNLYIEGPSTNWKDHIDWGTYNYLIRNSVIFLNRVIDGNKYPLPEIDVATKLTRKIGLGGMGFHDLLLKLGIPYDSDEALEVAKEIERCLKSVAEGESKQSEFKNTSLTTIAPTGTISIIADASSGIEPVFNWVITRKDSLGEHYIVHPIFQQELSKIPMPEQFKNIAPVPDIYTKVIKHCHKTGTIQDIDWLPESFKRLFRNAMDINWKNHIKMQSVFQTNGVDMSISKTINLPNNATKNDIGEAIFMAWRTHCKGITIYRSGSRELEVLNTKKEDLPVPPTIQELRAGLEKQIIESVVVTSKEFPLKRPRLLYGGTYKVQSGCGKLYVTINERNGKPYEVFIQSGGSGGCEAGNQALGRTISLALRNGGDIRNIIKQLYKVKCPAALRNPRSEGKSCSDIVGKLITESIPDEDEDEEAYIKKIYATNSDSVSPENPQNELSLEECPDCHEKTLVRESGCKVCHVCGYNKCG